MRVAGAAPRGQKALGVSLVVIAAGFGGLLVAGSGGVRTALALSVALPLVVIALRAPRAALCSLVVWLVALGLVRRVTSGVSPKAAWGDPLILVGAITWVVLLVVAIERGAFARRTRLTNVVLVLWALLAVSALNPLQGGLTVGFGGTLVVVVPMAAFFVGRALVDDRLLGRLLWLVAWLGLVVAVYGLVQTFWGFPSWDEAWIRNEGYAALNVDGVIRAFASFSAASEYAGFLGLAVAAWLAHARGVLRLPVVAGALALLALALWLESSRSIIVITIASIGLMLAARAGVPLGRSLLLGVAVIAALPFVIGRLAPAQFSGDAGGRLAQHQVEGLADPFGENSTLPAHIELVRGGIISGVENPVGYGVGSITISGAKYGGVTGDAEGDPGRAPFAAGILGLVAYAAVVLIAIPSAYRLAARRRDPVSLAALGFLAVTLFQWLNGGQYAVIFWPWLVLGWVDAATSPGRETDRTEDRLAACLKEHSVIKDAGGVCSGCCVKASGR